MTNCENNIFLARVAEQAERFDDMVDQLERVLIAKGADISADERNLLSVANKNLISSTRSALRTISAIEQNPKYSKYVESLGDYKKTIQSKLQTDCQRIVDMIDTHVLQKECSGEAKVFFMKMVGDYYRYMAEGSNADQAKRHALDAYNQANEITLKPCNPIKLGLALNFSVFHYEQMQNRKTACDLADQALQNALEHIDELDEEDFRDAKSIIELLKENLNLWREEEEGVSNEIDDL